jgi:regulator of sigma E protease
MLDAIRGLIAWTPMGLPAFLFVITLVVFFHELGHFLVARFFGVKVEVFSVGFGKEIFGWNDKRGTRWKLSWLPVGGYVKFAGDADAASTPDRKAAARMSAAERNQMLAFKPVGQRAAVAAAGPFANFILAIVLLTGLFLYSGQTAITPLIGDVAKGSAADQAGIRSGDLVTRIGDTAITDFQQLPEIISTGSGQTLHMQLLRAGKPLELWVKPRMTTSPDGLGGTEDRFVIGVLPSRTAPLIHHSYNPLTAAGAALSQVVDIARGTLIGIGQIVTGKASVNQLHGPLGIGNITRKVAEFGFLPLLHLVAFLSVSIGLANLFPIPLLDGGHLLYYGCEAVLGRPLGERAQDVGFRLGLVLVLGLMLLTTWNDLVRLNLF